MKKGKITNGSLLYHPVHGLCRVERVLTDPQDRKSVSYSMVPKVATRMKARFVITACDLEMAGFHDLLSPREAKKILLYLKAAPSSPKSGNEHLPSPGKGAWDLAHTILGFAHDKFESRDQRKRQALQYSAKGLVGELSCVYKSSRKAIAHRIEKGLGPASRINPCVLSALAVAGED